MLSYHQGRRTVKEYGSCLRVLHSINEMIEHLSKRSTELLPANTKQTLSHLLLAINIMGFYKTGNLQVSYDDEYTIKYSDRTEYSAYAERCRADTEFGHELTKERMETISFNEFAQTVQHKWINSNKSASNVIDQTTKCKFRSRDVNTGHCSLMWRAPNITRAVHFNSRLNLPSTCLS